MITREIFKKIRTLEIRTKGLVNNLFGGEYNSAFKGRGMVFSEVRPYQFGDDIRLIDWNVTARSDEPYIKIFEEEREQTLMLCVDISTSGLFGSLNQRKIDLATELAAILAFSAIKNNDKVGLILFTDTIEKVIPPRKGKTHVLRLIRELFVTKPKSSGTEIKVAIEYVSRLMKRRAIITLISDFQDSGYERQLNILNQKHDVICLSIDDEVENDLPYMGLVPFLDTETGSYTVIDTSSERVRNEYRAKRLQQIEETRRKMRKLNVDHVRLLTNNSYIQPLISLFQKRQLRR